jgi:hypothetical protein
MEAVSKASNQRRFPLSMTDQRLAFFVIANPQGEAIRDIARTRNASPCLRREVDAARGDGKMTFEMVPSVLHYSILK